MEFNVLGSTLGFTGINTDFIPELLPSEGPQAYIKNANNILIKNGMIEKIRGTDYLNDVATQLGIASYRRILGLPIFKKYNDTKYLMAVTPQRLYYLQNNTTWTNLGTITSGALDSIFSFGTVDDKFIFTLSDSKFIWYWDGTTFGKLFTSPTDANLKAVFVTEYQGHLFLIRTVESGVEYPQRLKWSNAHAPTIYSPADVFDVDFEQAINGGRVLGNELILYFPTGVMRWWFADDIYGPIAEVSSEGIGLYGSKTLCGTKDVHFFLSQEGLMALVAGSAPVSISDGKFNSLILDQIDPVYYDRAVARYYPHLKHLFLSYPKSGSTVNDRQLIFDVGAKELVSIKDLPADNYSCYGEFEKDLSTLTVDERKSYGMSFVPIMGTDDGYVLERKVIAYQDKNANYESNVVFPPTFCKARDRNKRVLQISLYVEKFTASAITFTVDLANEMNETFTFAYSVTGTGATGIRRYDIKTDSLGVNVDCFGKEFTLKIKDVTNPYGWRLHGAEIRGYWATQK